MVGFTNVRYRLDVRLCPSLLSTGSSLLFIKTPVMTVRACDFSLGLGGRLAFDSNGRKFKISSFPIRLWEIWKKATKVGKCSY